MCFEIGFYDNKGNISISLQTQSCRNIIKQLMEMSDLEQLQFIENIKNINVKRKVLQDMDIVLKNYNKLLDDIYDEEEFQRSNGKVENGATIRTLLALRHILFTTHEVA